MTERDTAERVRVLIGLADRLRMPSHRRTAETVMADQDEVRSGLRQLYKDLTGADVPRDAHGGHQAPSLRSTKAALPTAILRDRQRRADRALARA